MHAAVPVAISLGSNVGNRLEHLEHAIAALSRELQSVTVSSIVESQAAELALGQPAYLNAVVTGETSLCARALLDRLLSLENERGRARPYAMAPRTLDLDLLLYGSSVIDEDGLIVPHPRFRTREFVLGPLASIAPEMVDPVTNKTVTQLLMELRDITD